MTCWLVVVTKIPMILNSVVNCRQKQHCCCSAEGGDGGGACWGMCTERYGGNINKTMSALAWNSENVSTTRQLKNAT